MTDEPIDAGNEQDDSDSRGYEAFKASLRKAADKCKTRSQEIKDYFGKLENWVSFGTLIFVAGYTCVSLWQSLIVRDQERRQLRAYVGAFAPPPGTPILSLQDDGRFAVHLGIRNYGATPAYGLEYLSGINIRDYPLPDNIDWSIPPSKEPPSRLTLFPGSADGEMIAVMSRPLTESEIGSFRDGKTHQILMWGTITYRDAFRTNHFTDFCVGIFGDPTGKVIYHRPCDRHTDSD
jgi:hypothetical protein